MLHVRLQELELDLRLSLAGPLLVKEGEQLDQEAKDDPCQLGGSRRPEEKRGDKGPQEIMRFVCMKRAGSTDLLYLPGSGLKGALRSAAERRVNTYAATKGTWPACCDPFDREASCGERAVKEEDRPRERDHAAPENSRTASEAIYAAACPICRCFGHTRLAGRWRISDALPVRPGARPSAEQLRKAGQEQAGRLRKRDGVGISRRTGGSEPQVLYAYETLTGGDFYARLTLTNYELWQPGLLAYLLADLNAGHIRIGYGTRRGLGRVQAHVEAVRWRFPARAPTLAGDRLVLAPLGQGGALAGYELHDGDAPVTVGPVQQTGRGPLATWTLQGGEEALEAFWAAVAPRWMALLAAPLAEKGAENG